MCEPAHMVILFAIFQDLKSAKKKKKKKTSKYPHFEVAEKSLR